MTELLNVFRCNKCGAIQSARASGAKWKCKAEACRKTGAWTKKGLDAVYIYARGVKAPDAAHAVKEMKLKSAGFRQTKPGVWERGKGAAQGVLP